MAACAFGTRSAIAMGMMRIERGMHDVTGGAVAGAFWRPRNVGVTLFALVGGLVLAGTGAPAVAIGLAVTGLIAHAGLAAVDLSRTDGNRPKLLPAPASHLIVAPELRELYDRIVLKDGQVRRLLPRDCDLARRSRELVRQAGLAARRANAVHAYLQGERQVMLEAEATELEARAKRVSDPSAASAFTEAAVVKLQQLDTRAEIQGMFDRTVARLALVEVSLDAMRAKLVKLDAVTSEGAAGDVDGDVPDQLAAIDADMRLLEEVVSGDAAVDELLP